MFLSKEGILAFVQPTPPLKGVAVLKLEGVHEIAHHEWHLFDQMSDSGSLQIVLRLLEKEKEKLAYVNLTWGPTPPPLHNVTFIVYILQVKIIFRLNFFNLGWFFIFFVS